MSMNLGNKEKNNAKINGIGIFKKYIKGLSTSLYAEEPQSDEPDKQNNGTQSTTEGDTSSTPTPDTNSEEKDVTFNYEDLVSKARAEEKNKLYPQITGLKKEVKTLTEKNNNNLLTIGKKDTRIEELEQELKSIKQDKGKSESEETKELKKTISKLKKTIKDLESNQVDVKELEEGIKTQYETKLYREKKLREGQGKIIEELVTGSTKEEIDASFQKARERYDSIENSIVSKVTNNIPPVNTSFNDNFNSMKMEDIANLDVNSPEYKEFRKKLKLR